MTGLVYLPHEKERGNSDNEWYLFGKGAECT